MAFGGNGPGMGGPGVRLYPPEIEENPDAGKKMPVDTPGSGSPGKSDAQPPEPPGVPVGIPKFVQVRPKIANGRRPALDDGLDWLQAHGYKTVLFLHGPQTSASADRKQVENRGMNFLDLEVSPTTLSPSIIDEFSRIVGDGAGLPLFVYDLDGSLAGALWYLHFRMTLRTADDVARSQARPLGLRDGGEGDGGEAAHQMWLATQKLLSEMPR
jgi:hypothetical protein